MKVDNTEFLKEEVRTLRSRVAELEAQLRFLETHEFIAQGLRGESLTCELTGGVASALGEGYDVLVGGLLKLEVKFSRLRTPVKGATTRRWQWTRPLGWKNYGKDYDLLLLIGERDHRYANQYPDDSGYVYFLIPKPNVRALMTVDREMGAGHITVGTNLENTRSAHSKIIKRFLVPFDRIKALTPVLRAVSSDAPSL
jgi:hypothetical protein